MKTNYRTIIGLLASGALVATATPAVQALALEANAAADNGTGTPPTTAQANNGTEMTPSSRAVNVPNITGSFSYNQKVVASNSTLAKTLYKASDYLCGQGVLERTTTKGDYTTIEVRGDVGHAFTANINEQAKKDPLTKIMGCTCAGNPEDGSASANAQVKGFRLAGLIHEAEPARDANTITFISHDGFTVSLPLAYVTQRYSIIVTEINGEALDDTAGCANQLWLGSTSARYFAQDIVAIEITSEQTPPPAPGASNQTNQPNVGITTGSGS